MTDTDGPALRMFKGDEVFVLAHTDREGAIAAYCRAHDLDRVTTSVQLTQVDGGFWVGTAHVSDLQPGFPIPGYDSRADTLAHSQRVGELMMQLIHDLLDRSTCHDRSKTLPPEVEVFDEFTPKLKTTTYGSEQYKEHLKAMGPALHHHYAVNRHHPEHHSGGINGMTLVDLIEMLADWKAATERHDDGSLDRSLGIQQNRFGISVQLHAVLRNTALLYGWLDSTS